MKEEEIQHFFETYIGQKAQSFSMLPQSGSERKNFVGTSDDAQYIITYNINIRENEAFFYWSDLFQKLGLNTPKVFAISKDRLVYLQEFVGGQTLSEIIAEEGLSERVKKLVRKTLDLLFQLQQKTLGKADFSQSFEYEKYDDLPITHDLYYFKNFFVDVLEIPYHKSSLLKEFKLLVKAIENLEPKVVMMRDFQARNIMIDEQDEVFFIDYQAAMEGPTMYDAISFLFQAKANFPEDFKKESLSYYIQLWDRDVQPQLAESVFYIRLIRYLQVLGAYGFRGLIQRKPHFINSIPQGIRNLVELCKQNDVSQYPELSQIIRQIHSSETENKLNQLIKTKSTP